MEYIAPNGIKFTSKDNEFSFDTFITIADNNIIVSVTSDVYVQFENGEYIDSYDLPF